MPSLQSIISELIEEKPEYQAINKVFLKVTDIPNLVTVCHGLEKTVMANQALQDYYYGLMLKLAEADLSDYAREILPFTWVSDYSVNFFDKLTDQVIQQAWQLENTHPDYAFPRDNYALFSLLIRLLGFYSLDYTYENYRIDSALDFDHHLHHDFEYTWQDKPLIQRWEKQLKKTEPLRPSIDNLSESHTVQLRFGEAMRLTGGESEKKFIVIPYKKDTCVVTIMDCHGKLYVTQSSLRDGQNLGQFYGPSTIQLPALDLYLNQVDSKENVLVATLIDESSCSLGAVIGAVAGQLKSYSYRINRRNEPSSTHMNGSFDVIVSTEERRLYVRCGDEIAPLYGCHLQQVDKQELPKEPVASIVASSMP